MARRKRGTAGFTTAQLAEMLYYFLLRHHGQSIEALCLHFPQYGSLAVRHAVSALYQAQRVEWNASKQIWQVMIPAEWFGAEITDDDALCRYRNDHHQLLGRLLNETETDSDGQFLQMNTLIR